MKVAITGANGDLGRIVTPYLCERHEVRAGVFDLAPGRPPADLGNGLELVRLDITSYDEVASFLAGADAVVHLAAEREIEAPWERLVGPNIGGTRNVFEAAVENSLERVVYASSSHAIGGYPLAEQRGLDGSEVVRPDSLYGVTKAFGEALGRFYADAYGLRVVCLRIGWVIPVPFDELGHRIWLSAGDLCSLVAGALDADVAYGVYFGASRNPAMDWDLGPARADLGYEPRDSSADPTA